MEVQERKVFVCGLPREVNEGTLAEYFTKYGSVWRTYVVRDRITKNSKGHGFVWFDDSSSAKRALEESTGHVILGKTVQVKKSIQKNGPYQNQQHPSSGQVICGNGCTDSYGMQFRTKKIFVGGLPASLTREEFKDFFEQFGGTTDVVIMFDNLTQRPRGFGFVTFESEESVENVMQNNYYILNDRKVEVKRAVPKTEIIRHHEYNPSWSYTTYGGTYPGYSYFPGFYSMVHYWPPYPYGMVPFYSTGMVEVPGTSTSMFNPLSVKVNTHTNSTFSATADPKLDHVALGIGDLKLDADSKEEERGTASSS